MVQYSFASTGTRRLVRTDSPGRPPRHSSCSWTVSESSGWADSSAYIWEGSFHPRCLFWDCRRLVAFLLLTIHNPSTPPHPPISPIPWFLFCCWRHMGYWVWFSTFSCSCALHEGLYFWNSRNLSDLPLQVSEEHSQAVIWSGGDCAQWKGPLIAVTALALLLFVGMK